MGSVDVEGSEQHDEGGKADDEVEEKSRRSHRRGRRRWSQRLRKGRERDIEADIETGTKHDENAEIVGKI